MQHLNSDSWTTFIALKSNDRNKMERRTSSLLSYYFLWIFIFAMFPHCDASCSTKALRSGIVIDCSNSNLVKVPQDGDQSEVQVLHLRYNKIPQIKFGDFSNYTNLIKLDLHGNGITTIGENAFAGLHRLRKLDLSKNFIRQIPVSALIPFSASLLRFSIQLNPIAHLPRLKTFEKLRHLNASYNTFLREISPGDLPPSLSELDLRYTGILNFQESSFKNLRNLKVLHLQDNLASSSVSFEKGVFDDLTSLRHLDLSRTFCKKLSADSFKNLSDLRTLRMKSCWLSEIPTFFIEKDSKNVTLNPKLVELDLSNNRRMVIDSKQTRFPPSLRELFIGRTKLPVIDEYLFQDIKKLRKLDLCQSKVKEIAEKAFLHLDELQEICLSQNSFECGPIFPADLRTLQLTLTKVTKISVKMMERLTSVTAVNAESNEISEIQDFSFRTMTALRKIDLSQNKLKAISRHALEIGDFHHNLSRHASQMSNSKLAELNISSNLIFHIDLGAFRAHTSLRVLDLRDNELKKIGNGMLMGLHNLEVLRLDSNFIKVIEPDALKNLAKVQLLDLSGNMLTSISYEMVRDLRELTELRLNDNDLTSAGIIKLPMLKILDISFNRLGRLPIWKENSLRILKASQNKFRNITFDSLQGLYQLQELDLSDNAITEIDYKTFQYTPDLRRLELDGNNINKFLDHELPNLLDLNFENNSIQKVNVALSAITPTLRKLNLSFTNISYVDPSIFDGMDTLTSVDFSFGDFHCDCDLKPFSDWIETNLDIVEDAEAYFCRGFRDVFVLLDVMRDLRCYGELEENDREMNDSAEYEECICID